MQGYVINQPDHALHGGPGRPVNLLHGTRVLVGADLPRLCQRCAVSTQPREAVCRESRYWSPEVLAVLWRHVPEPCAQAFMAALYVKSEGSRYGPHDVQRALATRWQRKLGRRPCYGCARSRGRSRATTPRGDGGPLCSRPSHGIGVGRRCVGYHGAPV
jgi:hypothetical protein